jgi:hypothetical protein
MGLCDPLLHHPLETSYEAVVDEPQHIKMSIHPTNNLSMKEGSLICIVVMRSTEPGCFRSSCSWCLWKALNKKGCIGLVPMTFGLAVQKFLNIEWIFKLKIKLNHSWKFRRNWNVPLVWLGRSWWAAFNGIYLVRFRIQNVGVIDF